MAAESPTVLGYSQVQKTKYAIILLLAILEDTAKVFGSALKLGQMDSSMMSMHEAPIYVLMLPKVVISKLWCLSTRICPGNLTYPKYIKPSTRRDNTAKYEK